MAKAKTYRIMMQYPMENPDPITVDTGKTAAEAKKFLDRMELAWKKMSGGVQRTNTSVETQGLRVYIEEEPDAPEEEEI